jgi:hypothetical protein
MTGNAITKVETSNPVADLADLASRIRAEHQAVCASARKTLLHALNAGDLLLAAKNLIPHGLFGDWLREHCDVADRTAQRYMQLARNRSALLEANPSATADLSIDEAVRVLAKPQLPVTIDADHFIVPSFDYLPHDGQIRIGVLQSFGCYQMFGVREDPRYPGFYQIAQSEFFGGGGDDDEGSASWCEPNGGRPIRGDGVRTFFEHAMRRPEQFDQIEWGDHDCWPFPEPKPRWPAWDKNKRSMSG